MYFIRVLHNVRIHGMKFQKMRISGISGMRIADIIMPGMGLNDTRILDIVYSKNEFK